MRKKDERRVHVEETRFVGIMFGKTRWAKTQNEKVKDSAGENM